MSEFGSRLRRTMDQQELTDGIMAAELGLNKRTFNHYINGRAEPKFSTLCAISDTLGVSLHWLLTGNGPMDLPDADHPEIQTPPVDFLPVVDRGAEPARTASRAGNLPEGASSDRAPSGVSSGFVDVTAAMDAARSRRLHKRARAAAIDPDFVTFQGEEIKEIRPSFWKRVLPWLGDIIGCASLFALLFMGLWAGEIFG